MTDVAQTVEDIADNLSDDPGAAPDWSGVNRRSKDVTLMRIRLLEKGLNEHVGHCARLQKTVLGTVLFTAGWVVTHSPEVGSFVAKIITHASGG